MGKRQKNAVAAANVRPEAAPPRAAQYTRTRMDIETAKLKAAPWNPRGEITPESVADLAASIASLGMIQPVVAIPDGGGDGWTLVAGHRRLVAARVAGLDRVPCDVLEGVDESTARRMTFIENLQRMDADPLLEAELVAGLVKSGMTQGEIAAETGRGEKWVARRANLANLSKSWRERVAGGEQITTDCLEHIAAYPAEIQERMRKEGHYHGAHALGWSDLRWSFGCETRDLKEAAFGTAACRACAKNTGCAPDLFDWDGKPAALGMCLDRQCFRRKCELAANEAIDAAKGDGKAVVRSDAEPDYSTELRAKPDKRHNTLYVWKGGDGETRIKWGLAPKGKGKRVEAKDEKQKEEHRQKVAANKARRKLAEWCESNLAGAIMATYTVDTQIALAFQIAFNIGSTWRVFGSNTNTSDAAMAYLLDPYAQDFAPMERWAGLAAAEIAEKIARPEIGATYAERLLAILPPVAEALTADERKLVASDETVLKLRNPVKVAWDSQPKDAGAEND